LNESEHRSEITLENYRNVIFIRLLGMILLAQSVSSFKRFAIVLTFLIVLGISVIYLFDLFVAVPINLPVFLRQAFRVILIIGFWITILMLLRGARPLMLTRIGAQATMVVQYFLGAMSILIMSFGVLQTLGVSPETLLAGAGIASITVGLIVSTFIGGILAGALVFTSHQFRVGDTVLVNNIPGRVTDMTALVTRIRTDVGQISIPNSAIASGAVIITTVQKYETKAESPNRLPYSQGDRVVTTLMNEQGLVKELTPLHTIILLDSGKELTILNNNILSGAIAVAKVTTAKTDKTQTQ
jgi:small-conductance mechanosensitive channel